MSTHDPPPTQETHTLTTLRLHLQSLTSSLQKLTSEISLSPPSATLPPYPALLDSLNFTSHHLQQAAACAARERTFLASSRAYAMPTFPARHEALVAQLLGEGAGKDGREGRELAVRELEGRMAAGGGEGDVEMDVGSGEVGKMRRETGRVLGLGEMRELWAFAAGKAEEEIARVPRGMDYTIEEAVNGVQKVRTGVERKLFAGPFGGEDEDGESEFGSEMDSDEFDEDDGEGGEGGGDGEDGGKMDVDMEAGEEGEGEGVGGGMAVDPTLPPMPLEDVLRFMTTGQLPRTGNMVMG